MPEHLLYEYTTFFNYINDDGLINAFIWTAQK